MQVFSENFYQSCVPYPRDVLHAVVSRLPKIAYKRNEDLLTIIKVGKPVQESFQGAVSFPVSTLLHKYLPPPLPILNATVLVLAAQ